MWKRMRKISMVTKCVFVSKNSSCDKYSLDPTWPLQTLNTTGPRSTIARSTISLGIFRAARDLSLNLGSCHHHLRIWNWGSLSGQGIYSLLYCVDTLCRSWIPTWPAGYHAHGSSFTASTFLIAFASFTCSCCELFHLPSHRGNSKFQAPLLR